MTKPLRAAAGQAASAGALSPTERTRHRRLREQGRTERAELFAVLRAGFEHAVNYRSAMAGRIAWPVPPAAG